MAFYLHNLTLRNKYLTMRKNKSETEIYNTTIEGKVIEVFKKEEYNKIKIRFNTDILEIELKKPHDFHLGETLKINCETIINNIY